MPSDGGYWGNYYRRLTLTSTASDSSFPTNYAASGTETYQTLAYVSSNAADGGAPYFLRVQRLDASDTSLGFSTGSTITTSGSWQVVRATLPPTTSMAKIKPLIYSNTFSFTTGDTFDFDAIMITAGTKQFPHRDGSSSGWFWTGAPNNSTSIGSAVAL